LEPAYDPNRERPDRDAIARRAPSLWRYKEWLPFLGEPIHSTEVGFTPLIEVPSLARVLGVRGLWVKNDAVSFPSLSFKDRVVATGINAARALGLEAIGCASTGNLANAVAAQAARAGFPSWVFIPDDLEQGKVVGTAVYGSRLLRVRGTYDDVNRLCVLVADRFGWGFVNINLRSYYGEGSKTLAFETVEQLGWRLPTAVVAPMAGGSLVTKLHKGFGEFLADGLVTGQTPRVFGAQAAGCAPIVRLVERGCGGIEPEVPNTIARSIAIGNPADGSYAARIIRDSCGWAVAVSDEELIEGIRLLAEHAGIFTETAGGVTMAGTRSLAKFGHLRNTDEVVLYITGNGLKTTEAVTDQLEQLPVIAPSIRDVERIAEELFAAIT
jgi:threonine synthase